MAIQIYTTEGAVCGEFVSGEMLCGEEGDQYTLPATLTIENDDADFRFKEEERAFQHGSVAFGQEWEARDITVAGTVKADSATDARSLLRAIRKAAARPDQRLRLDADADHYIVAARLRRMDARWVDLTGRTLADVRLVWRATNPFWQAATPGSHTEELTGDGTFTVDTDLLATVPMSPVVTVTAPSSGSVPSVRLTNDTDEGQAFLYEDLQLEDGAVLVIDCGAGIVTRDGENTIRFLSGGWLRLLPGENVLAYEGDACALTLTWRPRWI